MRSPDTHGRTPAELGGGAVVVFDTDCVLCSRWVRFLVATEVRPDLVFVGAWSTTGRALAARHGFDGDDLQRTYLVVERGRSLTRSDATIALLGHLRAPWRWLRLLALVPRPLRDRLYTHVAERRYTWFGRRADCYVPPPGARHRFIQD